MLGNSFGQDWNITFLERDCSGVQSKNNVYHIVDKVQNSYENTLKLDLIDNVVYVVFALYSSVHKLRNMKIVLDCIGD